ncbi:BREX-2 system phosphatase PglZ [Corallococcus sp. CA053C]|nr:BREX-2 system phosphatase PglZ [Corallococcus sp. CA053C]
MARDEGEVVSEAPYLSLRDLEEEVGAIHRTRHRSPNVALYGRGEPASLIATMEGSSRSFQAVPVRCELELRQALQQAGDTPVVLLVDYGTDLPLDVEARLAGGRIHFVADARRVARLFGASAASAELLDSPLAKALLEDLSVQAGPLPGATVDLETAWRWFLHRRVALPNEPGLSEDRILAFCATSPAGPEFGRYLQERPRLRQALYDYLDRASGPVARITWRAWEAGQGRKLAALTLLLEAAAPALANDPNLKARMVGVLAQVDPSLQDAPLKDPALLLRWGELADRLVLRLTDELLSPLLEEAQSLLPAEDARDALADGRYLPGAFQRTADLLGEALVRATEHGSETHFRAASDLLVRLTRHHLARRQTERIERARMAMRLLAYRRERPDIEELSRHGSSYEEMVLLAEEYSREGGYVDYALRLARGSASDALGRGVEKVVAAIETLRDGDDARFARGLAAWMRAGRKSDRVVPIDTALDRFALQFLNGGAHRKLLVLLLDGMAWANAVELLMDLEAHQVAPVRWRPKGAGATRALLPPMLAALPTVTEVSRSAFFSGRLMAPGAQLDTGKDPDRFAEHRGLSGLIGVLPRLLLRHDVQSLNGAASEQARKLVLSEDRVVALVVNAIDEQLKGGRQIRVEYKLQTIKPLRDLLDAAALAGRAVLMVADHGHVPGSRMSRLAVPVEAGGARWRILAEEEAAHPNEVVFSEDEVWRPRGKKRVGLLFRESDSYGAMSHEGEHGGASLAEVVAPALLVASESLSRKYEAEGYEDREVEVVSFPRPGWWDYEVRPVQRPLHASPPVPMSPPTVLNQEAFSFQVLPVPGPRAYEPLASRPQSQRAPAKQKAASSPMGALLRKSPLLKDVAGKKRDELENKIIPWVEVLVEHEGRMPPDVFAQRTGELPFRVRGAVTKLAEWLNLDGQPVAFFDETEKVVRLDVEALKQMFGGSK